MNLAKPLAELSRPGPTKLPAASQGLTLNDERYIQEPARWSGQEITYAEITSDVTITATTDATANTLVTAPTVEFDGKVVLIEFFCARADPPDADEGFLVFNLYQDGSDAGRIWAVSTSSAEISGNGVHGARRMSPSKGAHTYSVRCWRSAGGANGTVRAEGGGGGKWLPAFVRITRAGTQTP